MRLSLADCRAAARLLVVRFRKARCSDAASNLAFTTLIAIVPLIAIVFAIVSVFPVFETLSDELQGFVADNLVPQAADKVFRVYLTEFAGNAARLSAIGLVVLVITGLILVLSIESAFDDIWRIEQRGRRAKRLAVYSLLVIVGPLLIGASLWLTSLLVSWSMGWFPYLDDAMVLTLRLLPFGLTIVAFALLYFALPNQSVRFVDAAIGGLVAGVLFELTKRGFGLYVTHIATYQAIYGAFATVPIFLIWVYLSWLVVLIGAVLVAAMPRLRTLSTRARAEAEAEADEAAAESRAADQRERSAGG